MPQNYLRCIVLAAAVGISGCGDEQVPRHTVKGMVVFSDGSPMTAGGVVMFQSLDTKSAELTLDAKGELREDGTFELSTRDLGPGAAAGEYKALVRANPDFKKNPQYPPPTIHPRFNRFQTSGLEFTVEEGENDFTIVVELPAAQSARSPFHR